jgi:hypothetical protein
MLYFENSIANLFSMTGTFLFLASVIFESEMMVNVF